MLNFDELFYDGMLFAMEGENPSKAIERQERRETIKAVQMSRLPKKSNDTFVPHEILVEGVTDDMDWSMRHQLCTKNNHQWTIRQYNIMGIKVLGEADDLFLNVQLPNGWISSITDHSMWNEIRDDKGRVRISYFYKGAFYDREAFSNFTQRYNYRVLPFDNYETDASYEDRKFKPWRLVIIDSDKEIEVLETYTPTTDQEYFDMDNNLGKIAVDYLNHNYPGWKQINAYWGKD